METFKQYFLSVALLVGVCLFDWYASGRPALARAEAAEAPAPGYHLVTFETLAGFKWNTPPAGAKGKTLSSIPPGIRSLNGSKASILGFMIPLQMADGAPTSFLLCRTRAACCYGVAPNMNEFIVCDVPSGQHCKIIMDMPMKVSGTLKVGEEIEKGVVLSIYHMNVEEVDIPDNS